MGALHLAYVHETPVRKKRRKGGGGDDDEPPYIVPQGSCEACVEHLHHKCWGANILDEDRPDCPCPCGDPTDDTGQRLSARAWTDLARHRPDQVWIATRLLRFREAGEVRACSWRSDGSGLERADR